MSEIRDADETDLSRDAASVASHERAGYREAGPSREVGRAFDRWPDPPVTRRLSSEVQPR